MLTASEIAALIERGEIAWPGELRGDGLLLRLGSPLQLLADPGHVIDLANQPSIDTLRCHPPSNPARPLRSARATRQPLRRRVRRPAHS
jgi:hypothetical protein